MHSGFNSLRSALPMNLKGDFPNYKVWSKARGDIERITTIWHECLDEYGGPFLFGKKRCLADAMYAPVVTRCRTYHVTLDEQCETYGDTIMAMAEMKEWIAAAKLEQVAEERQPLRSGWRLYRLQHGNVPLAGDGYRYPAAGLPSRPARCWLHRRFARGLGIR